MERVASSNLLLRLATALVVVPLLLALLYLGPAWGWFLLVLVATPIAAFELFAMTHPDDRVSQSVLTAITVAVLATLYFFTDDARALLTLLFGLTALGVLLPLWRLGEIRSAGFRATAGIAGPLYVGAMLAALALLRRDNEPWGGALVVLTLTIAWFGDTGGYFFGKYLGKTKLYEAVSPKKTRAGFVGSLLGSCLAATLAHFWYLPALSLPTALMLAIVIGTLGQLGDLAESLLKRSTGIKDSGNIIPGHGGLLDRVDAVLLAAPTLYVYLLWQPLPAS